MYKLTIKSLVLVMVFLCAGNLFAQVQKTQENNADVQNNKAQWEKFFSSAKESAIFENEKIIFMKLPIPNEGEKQFTFEHTKDGKSFFMTDEKGVRLQVFLDDNGKVSSVIMPDGKRTFLSWKTTTTDYQVLDSIKVDGQNLNLLEAPGGDPCRDALVAGAIAAGVCAATGGAVSPACWAATANAAYHTYRCYEATR